MIRSPGPAPLAVAALLLFALEGLAVAQTCNGDTLINRGAISPSTSTQTVAGSVLAAQGDYYSFSVASTGSYLFSLCAARGGAASYDSYLCILDSTFALIVSNDDFCGLSSQLSRNLAPGTYYIAVSSFGSGSGTYTLAYLTDTTPPVAGVVSDGTGVDVEWQTSTSTLAANWTAFSDPESGISQYEWAIGTAPGATNIRTYSWVGTATSASTSSLALSGGSTYFVTVRATNGTGGQATASSDGVAVFAMTASVAAPNAMIGQAYATTLPASFGTGPYTWVQELGDLPPGLSLAADGAVTGTPTSTGGYLFGALVTDALAAVRRIAYSILVLPSVGGLVVTSGNPQVATEIPSVPLYNFSTFTAGASGGQVPYIWRISAGTPPPGLTLDSLSGVLSGYPSRPGTFAFTLTASDTDDPTQEASALLSMTVTGAPSALGVSSPAVLPGGETGAPYAALLLASGGSGACTWSVTSGSLPSGLTLDPAGTIEGTPDAIGVFPFTITATDGAAAVANRAVSITIVQGLGPLELSPAELPLAAQGLVYPLGFSATGGTPGYIWSVTSGALPSGLSLDPVSGALIGSPSASGVYRFVVRVLDSGSPPSSAARKYELNVLRSSTGGYVIITPSPLPAADHGRPYRTAMAVVGGTNPHAWQIFSGVLPAGLSLNANTGELAGTPSGPGTYSFALLASSGSGILSSVRPYTLRVAGSLPAVGGGGSGGRCGLLGLELLAPAGLLLLLRRRKRRAA